MALFKKDSKKENGGKAIAQDLSWVLVRPLVTEKAAMVSDNNVYTFVVSKDANKVQIKQAIKAAYKVTPLAINTIRSQPRKATKRGRKVHVKGMKKAMVTLKKGDSIDLA